MLGPRSRPTRPSVAIGALLFALLACVGLLGCAADDSAPELLNVIDVAPREVDVGDRIEVLGTMLPTGEAREAKVTFKGELRRAGQTPVDAEITVEKAQVSTDKVSMIFTEGLESRFCGHGDEATHTTFHGDIEVSLPSVQGGLPVKGTVRGVDINFRPPTPRRAVVEARTREGNRALKFMGISVAAESPSAGGLLVADVTPSSPANRAAILPGDLIVSFAGVKVQSIGDMTPSGSERLPTISIKRGTEPPAERQISIEGFDIRPPSDLLGAGLVLAIAAAIILLFMAPTAGIITWVERRVSARMQSRIGPNRAGPQGFLVWIADGIKSIMKEDIVPTEATSRSSGWPLTSSSWAYRPRSWSCPSAST